MTLKEALDAYGVCARCGGKLITGWIVSPDHYFVPVGCPACQTEVVLYMEEDALLRAIEKKCIYV